MKHERDILERESGIPAHPERGASAVSVVVGAIMGAGVAFFSATGRIGLLIGAVLGAVAGLAIAQLSRKLYERHRVRDAQLDREIGVIDGTIGSAPPRPPRRVTS